MIVFDLKCLKGHVFEAWFGSSAAFSDQKAAGLLACPICGYAEVDKAVMAPNIPAKGNQRLDTPALAVGKAEPAPQEVKAFIEQLAKAQAALLGKSEWVGSDFATKARAMDAGEIDQTLIHGQTTPDEAQSLIEDGIAVLPLPLPVIPPDKQN